MFPPIAFVFGFGTAAESLPLALEYLRVILVAMPATLLLILSMMAIGAYLHGGWRRKDVAPPVPTAHECAEKARTDQHPGMATAPA